MAHIPFDFQVAGKILPAGDYSVRPITESGSGLLIRADDGDTAVIVLANAATEGVNAGGHARLTFRRYGDQYFLATVWGPEGEGRMVRTSKRERSLRKEMQIAARAGLAPEQMQLVTIAAR